MSAPSAGRTRSQSVTLARPIFDESTSTSPKRWAAAASDRVADTVTVVGTNGVDSIRAGALGAAAEVTGLGATVRVTHADPEFDTLVLDTLDGVDDVSVDPDVEDLILVSVK